MNYESNLKIVTKTVRFLIFDYKIDTTFLSEEDLIQEGMLALLKAEKIYNKERGAKFETYIRHVIKNRIVDLLRKQNNSPDSGAEQAQNTVGESLEQTFEKMELERALEQTLEGCTEIERAIFNSYVQGYTYSEIAEIFEISKKKIDNTIQKVRGLVRGR